MSPHADGLGLAAQAAGLGGAGHEEAVVAAPDVARSSSSGSSGAAPRVVPRLLARTLSRLITWYQVGHQDRPSPCRFVPSCSTYALEALAAHGALKGTILAVRRLLRCHPWGGHGFDPVPSASTPSRESSPSCST